MGNSNKNFSNVKATAPAPTGTSGWRKNRLLLASVGAIAVVIVVVLAFILWPASSSSGGGEPAQVGTPHGPRSVTEGIPTGYTQDPDGAGAAAANFLQALGEASRGRVSVDKLKSASISGTPEGKLADVLNDANGRKEIEGQPGNTYPMSVTVGNYTPKSATVTVWQASIGMFTPPKSSITNVAVVWGTTTVTMNWDEDKGTWLAKDYAYKNGPNPYEVTTIPTDDPLVKGFRSGSYTLIVN